MAADLSQRLGYISQADLQRIRSLVAAAGLPVQPPELNVATWLEWMQVDKKNDDGQIKFILLNPMGRAVVESVPATILEATLRAYG
jgi:shikimate kinase/3-dehydroquinate synthase